MRRAALLFNPRAGQGRGARTLEAIAAALRASWALEVVPTEGPRHCKELARRAVADGLAALFVLGGDGTLRIAAGELLGSEVALGPLPGGTTNVVAFALGLPRDPVAAARRLAEGCVRELDAGRAGEGVFLMQLSGGLDAQVLAAVDLRLKRRLGKLAVAWAGLREWSRYRFPAFELEVDGERLRATGFVAANLAEYAGSFAIVPGARADDAELELLVYRGARRRQALGFALDLARGRHAARPDVELRRISRLVVAAPEPLLLQGDGDFFTAAPPFEVRLSKRKLRVLAPADDPGRPTPPPPRQAAGGAAAPR
jgi:diacylglycerol kinase family enzyme